MAPVVYGGKVRAVMLYMNRDKMQARGLSPLDVMKAMDNYNVFLPAGDAKFGGVDKNGKFYGLDYAIDSNSMYDLVEKMGDIPLRTVHGNAAFMRGRRHSSRIRLISRPTSSGSTAASRSTSRSFASSASSTLKVVDTIKASLEDMKARG